MISFFGAGGRGAWAAKLSGAAAAGCAATSGEGSLLVLIWFSSASFAEFCFTLEPLEPRALLLLFATLGLGLSAGGVLAVGIEAGFSSAVATVPGTAASPTRRLLTTVLTPA